ncbi:LOW QUALITY PROTEIN: suppressor of lurcher protein 1 [Drosophila sulfurigaster albostrigata]|uniref:LOW QUALITY PROTEIN: suppressor of lurcher protein 1 n=1 Tax=Drosophila sulfurigaster albostrigata TaxID=89887 RepID=UPI002D21B9DA|nr:LOW QUALITY PROTEIN: suppressor of lurcher protein 1 [Drosophila sulfurigaster albostrigata]
MAAVWLPIVFLLSWSSTELSHGQQVVNSKQAQLFLDCSCLHANERNATQWGNLAINASHTVGAKNNCLMIFIGGTSDELVVFHLQQLQLRPGCLDTVEVFPYLREPVIENSTLASYTWCQHSDRNATPIYSAGRLLGLRLSFQQPPAKLTNWPLNLTASYRFLKQESFRTEGRLVPHSFCDYYFFASTSGDGQLGQGHFHSPRFPAHYPAHIKCAYKFIGRPDSRVELQFEELQLPPVTHGGCQLDAVTIFDAESAHMNAVIDVLCSPCPTRRIVSSGPDLLLEFNASSNRTAKGFRGKYKFVADEQRLVAPILEAASVALKPPLSAPAKENSLQDTQDAKGRSNQHCKHVFDSRVNKSGIFETNQLLGSFIGASIGKGIDSSVVVQCRYEFEAQQPERIQIRFHDFNIPTENENSTRCVEQDALHLLTEVRGKYDTQELFCGAFLPKPLMSSDQRLQLQFVGKYPPKMTNKVQYYGFRAEYKFLTNFGITSGVQQGSECTFVYNSSDRITGLFHSPNFPGYYLENVVCNYLFYGADERIVLRFTFFDVEGIGTCDHQTASDYVEFSNFMSTDRKYSRHCGKLPDFEVRSDRRFFRVTFHSNDRFVANGFRALYTFESTAPKNTGVNLELGENSVSMQSYVANRSHHLVVIHYLLLTIVTVVYAM